MFSLFANVNYIFRQFELYQMFQQFLAITLVVQTQAYAQIPRLYTQIHYFLSIEMFFIDFSNIWFY